MANQKKSSCLGLFFKSTVISSLVLANLVVAGAAVHIKFFDGDMVRWTDFSSPTSRPMLALFAVLTLALMLGFTLGLAGAALSAIFSDKAKQSSSPSRPRPQSNRKTTV